MSISMEQLGQYFHQEQPPESSEPIQPETQNDFPNSTYLVVSKVGYLLGVPTEVFTRGQLSIEHFKTMEKDKNARIIRNLCLVRNGIEQHYTRIQTAFRTDIKNLHTLPEYISQEAIRQLSADGIEIIKANYPLKNM